MNDSFELFVVFPPGLEDVAEAELRRHGFAPDMTVGGATVMGSFEELYRAHLWLRTPSKILVRLGRFHAPHFKILRREASQLEWQRFVSPGVPVRVKVSSRASRLYHTGAAADRVRSAMGDRLGEEPPAAKGADEGVTVRVRLENDECTVSLDATGEPLFRRGGKQSMGKAPLRENLAAGILGLLGYDGSVPLVDPMCGSGTFPLEAARIAANIAPGLQRSFAFMDWPGYAAEAWERLCEDARTQQRVPAAPIVASDRDEGAAKATRENAERAGVAHYIEVRVQALSHARPPGGAATGIVITNPPYGERVGDKKALRRLYGAIGAVAREHFVGWRVGVVTTDPKLAYLTGLAQMRASAYLPHGGLKIRLYSGLSAAR